MPDKLPSIDRISSLAGARVLLRVDFNVPLADGQVADAYRIEQVRPTIEYLREAGARVVLISHFKGTEDNSLRPVAEYIDKYLFPLSFFPDCVGGRVFDRVQALENGEVLLLENLRLHSGEKDNDPDFARDLASLADIYVNEAFAVSHRAHASVVGLPPLLPAYAGYRLQEEVDRLTEAFDPPRPFVLILGGAKFDTKLPLVKKFLPRVNSLFLGGALAHNVFQARGLEVGRSLVSETEYQLEEMLENEKLLLPVDVVLENTEAVPPAGLGPEDRIMDAGPASLEMIREKLLGAAFVLWNGPLGDYEHGFTAGTLALARAVAECPAETIVGGGDTLAAIEELGILEEFSFVSTGGGAMLDLLANEDLPGLKALRDNAR